METINIHGAQTHLSRLVEKAARGEPFIIAKAGKPTVKVVPIDQPSGGEKRRLGFLAGQISVPDDFDRMGSDEIREAVRRMNLHSSRRRKSHAAAERVTRAMMQSGAVWRAISARGRSLRNTPFTITRK